MLQLQKQVNKTLLYNIRSFVIKPCGLMYSETNHSNNINNNNNNNNNNSKFIPIFKTSHMSFVIGLNKAKKYQTALSIGLVPICFSLNILGHLSFEEVIYASLIGFGLTTGLHIASWLISNNLVVFVYLSEDEQKCRLSYISYWGNREEFNCNIKDIEPIQCSNLDILNHKIKLSGSKNKFKIILHNATIFNNAKFRIVFGDNVI